MLKYNEVFTRKGELLEVQFFSRSTFSQ